MIDYIIISKEFLNIICNIINFSWKTISNNSYSYFLIFKTSISNANGSNYKLYIKVGTTYLPSFAITDFWIWCFNVCLTDTHLPNKLLKTLQLHNTNPVWTYLRLDYLQGKRFILLRMLAAEVINRILLAAVIILCLMISQLEYKPKQDIKWKMSR